MTATNLPTEPCGTGSTLSGPTLLSLTGDSLPTGGSCTFSVNAPIPPTQAPGDFPNTTSPLFDSGGLTITDPATATLTVAPQLLLTKAFTDDLNAVMSGLMETGLPQSNVCGGGEMRPSLTGTSLITFLLPNLAAGATCTFTVTVHVPATAASGTYPNATSAVTGGFPVVL